ncbi:MAG TPA: DUF4123 domain-containing protein [Pyrinomonadaceae bacterium]|nr:DUF4123 domain-containing protein [Pyrinomonadaceae bacterium]
MEGISKEINRRLFADDTRSVYAVLDGASVPDLRMKLYEHQPECICLFPGDLKPDMAEVAPYLIHLQIDAEFTNWVIENGWGNHWGIFALSRGEMRDMRNHFRRFLTVHTSEGRPMRFRYYDPRVMRMYLPTCNGEDLAVLFGQVDFYLLEDEDPRTMLSFHADSGALKREKFTLDGAAPAA